MRTILIAAVSPDLVIGRDGRLPWHYPEDMRHFARTTAGHPCIVGRRTYESFPHRPLPGRLNLVVTGNARYEAGAGALIFPSPGAALDHCRQLNAKRVFVLGGEGIYRQMLPDADEMILTHVPDRVAGDTHFPAWDRAAWEIVDSIEKGALRFLTYHRRRARPGTTGSDG